MSHQLAPYLRLRVFYNHSLQDERRKSVKSKSKSSPTCINYWLLLNSDTFPHRLLNTMWCFAMNISLITMFKKTAFSPPVYGFFFQLQKIKYSWGESNLFQALDAEMKKDISESECPEVLCEQPETSGWLKSSFSPAWSDWVLSSGKPAECDVIHRSSWVTNSIF